MHKLFKSIWFYIGAVLALLIVILAVWLFVPKSQSPAFLQSASGTVEVNSGSGFVAASQEQTLRESDVIRTGDNSTAIIVLYEHIIIRLEPQTQVKISDLSAGKQRVEEQYGGVWTKVAKLSGTEDYAIATPTTTATVRGTSLRTRGNATVFELLVGEGNVTAQGSNCTNCTTQVLGHQKLVLANGSYAYQNLTEEDKAAIREELGIELTTLRDLRLREVLKNKAIMRIARSRYNATDADVEQFLLDIDDGKQSETDVRANIPLMTPEIQRIFAYNAAIRQVMATIKEYE